LRIRRDVLEASVVSGLRTHLMRPELVREFIAEYHRELNRLNGTVDVDRNRQRDDLARTEREIRAVIEAIKSGLRTPSMQAELLDLEHRKERLMAAMKETQPILVRLRSDLPKLYQEKVERLDEALNHQDVRAEAADIFRALIQEIRLVPEDGQLEIELIGDPETILAFTNEFTGLGPVARAKITLVAGERYHLYRTTLRWAPK
jgi:site-specific DNA recombinase